MLKVNPKEEARCLYPFPIPAFRTNVHPPCWSKSWKWRGTLII